MDDKKSIDNPTEFTVESLVAAVQHGDFPFVETAIEVYKFSPNLRDSQDCTLLHWAAINNRVQIAKYLISMKAEIDSIGGLNKENPLQVHPFIHSYTHTPIHTHIYPLQWAVRNRKCAKMILILLDCDTDDHLYNSNLIIDKGTLYTIRSYTIKYTIYNIQYTLYTIQYTIYNIQYTI